MRYEEPLLTYVDSTDDVADLKRWLSEDRLILSYDTETKGLNHWEHPGTFARLAQFGDARRGWALSVNRWRGVVEEVLRDYRGPISGSNIKFDLVANKATGLPCPREYQIHDTMLMDQLLNPERAHGLKERAIMDISPRAVAGQERLKENFKTHGWDWETVPEEAIAYHGYAALDTVLDARLWEMWYPQLGSHQDAYELEVQYSILCADLEYRGVRVDRPYIGRLREQWENDLGDLSDLLRDRGIDKPNATAQVIAVLEREGWRPQQFSDKTGNPVVDKFVLAALGTDYETAQLVLDYRFLKQRITNYLNKMEKMADANEHIHSSIRVMGARTGRSSYTGITLQNFPKTYNVRRSIIPDPGNKLWACDYAAEEFLLLIGVTQDPVALELLESGKDVHKWVASQAYNASYDNIGKEDPRRQKAKNTLYASLYMATAEKVAKTAGISVAEAEMILQVINGGFSVMDHWRRDFTEKAQLMDKPIVQVGDRWIPLPEDREYTTAINTVIQGLGAQVLKRAGLRLKHAGFGDYLRIAVHDEWVFELPDEPESAEIAAEMGEIMVDRSFRPQLVTEVTGPLDSWGAAYRREAKDFD